MTTIDVSRPFAMASSAVRFLMLYQRDYGTKLVKLVRHQRQEIRQN